MAIDAAATAKLERKLERARRDGDAAAVAKLRAKLDKRAPSTRFVWRGRDADNEPPLLVSFPQGVPPEPACLAVRAQQLGAPDASGGGDDDARRLRVVASSADGAPSELLLEGQNSEASGARAQWLVGVRDRASGVVELFSARAQHVFVLRPNTAAFDAQRASETAASAWQSRDLTTAERHRQLFDDFGSREKKRRLNAQDAARIDADSTLGSHALGAELRAKAAAAAEGAAAAPSAVRVQNLVPPHDAATTDRASVYDALAIAGLADGGLRAALVAQASRLARDARASDEGWLPDKVLADRSSKPWPSFVTSRLQGGSLKRCPFGPGARDRALQNRACALVQLRHMMKLFVVRSPIRFDELIDQPNSMLPETVLTRLLDQFATPGNAPAVFLATKPLKDKLLAHVLALCLALNGGARANARGAARLLAPAAPRLYHVLIEPGAAHPPPSPPGAL